MRSSLVDTARAAYRELQIAITARLESLERQAGGQATFIEDAWERPGGGGGRSRVLQGGTLFEKAGVNWSDVHGELPADMAAGMPGQGTSFRASGMSMVIHPRSPMVPTMHANFRVIAKGDALWFGGGADLTPYYPVDEDCAHFHLSLKAACDRHDPAYYPAFKAWADRYFYLPHRKETRGVGGTFFDYLGSGATRHGDLAPGRDPQALLAFARDHGEAVMAGYGPVVERRMADPWGERERDFQLWRRGRYVEFNLLYDRGTVFGLKTGGRIESILMSLPAVAHWRYDWTPEPGSREEKALTYFTPREWVAI
jgi:coproporphyrinogen III oxidase